ASLAIGHLLEEQPWAVVVRVLNGRPRVALILRHPILARRSSHAASGSAPSGRSTPGGPGWDIGPFPHARFPATCWLTLAATPNIRMAIGKPPAGAVPHRQRTARPARRRLAGP